MKKENIEIIQINISGEDKPGLTSSLTGILACHDAFIPLIFSKTEKFLCNR